MNLYKSKALQVVFEVLYSASLFGFLCGRNVLSPWILIVVFALFCALWANVRYVLLSTAMMVVTTVPIWWFTIAPHQAGYSDILGWYPLIIFDFVVFVLLPEIIVVWGRNTVIRRNLN